MSTKKDWKALCYDPLCEIHNPAIESTQPKPTGEWTETWAAKIWRQELSIDANIRILIDSHNAALAAVLEEYNDEVRAAHVMQKQLAAERENNDAQADAYVLRINELNKQLAAALAKVGK